MVLLRTLTVLSFLTMLYLSYGQRDRKFFRKDYTYIQDIQSFYKIHTVPRTWHDAKAMCRWEGATLFYPEDGSEAEVFLKFMNDTQPLSFVFIGISSLLAKGVFETIDGIPVSDVYNNWSKGEPNDAGGNEDCVILRRDGTLNDDNCQKKYPFVCKKTLVSLEWNTPCNMPNLGKFDYIYNADIGRCYKFHLEPKNWTEAYSICNAEQSFLAIIESQTEADYLMQMTESAPKNSVGGNYLRGAVLLGFHNKDGEGWRTIRNIPIDESGYSKWGYAQPDGKDQEKCGSMFYNGQLNDLSCDRKCFFICEHDIDVLGAILNERFADS